MGNLLKRFFSIDYMLKKDEILGSLPTTREVYKNSFNMSWPCAFEAVLVSLVGSIDIMMVGGLGAEAIAAVGLTNQPKFVLLAMIFSLNVGVTAIVARRKGAEDFKGANSCLKQSIILSFIISLIMAISGYIFANEIMLFAGAGEDVINDSVAYYKILMVSIVFTSLSLTINAAQRGVGNTKISMRTNVVANIVNLIFNYFLINGVWIFPRLEVRGAAIATTLGSIVGFLMSVFSVYYNTRILDLRGKGNWKFDKATMKAFLSISGSSVVEQVFMRIGFFSFAIIVAALGTIAFATHQICMNVINLSFCFGDGLSAAAASLVGQNLGARRPDKAKIYGKTGQRMAFIVSTVLFFVFILARKQIIMLFNSEEHIVSLGGMIMIIIAFTTHAQTSQTVYNGCLRGAGDTKFVALISFISIALIRPGLAWILCFPANLGLKGAWIALFADQTMRYILGKKRFDSGKWTKIKI
ncbi:MATE family efflux transporter [Fusobacterium sp.]|uniref:MATE family efflux transporter n=1 Tax=Fusobacterium sp. TaxID=68766 RepID=UPI00261CE896|nr:MATE family efflux transporter [Fusobacterium sp.]MDY3060210.1 MATE family efflux transporter [Fusobacterium sp.]MEE1476034.1 MATE family efflux transporter [Fusobacterium sp.]